MWSPLKFELRVCFILGLQHDIGIEIPWDLCFGRFLMLQLAEANPAK